MEYKELAKAYNKLEKTSKRLEKTKIISDLLIKTKEEDLKAVIMLVRGKIFGDTDDREIGISSKLLAKGISLSLGYSLKEVNEKWKQTGDLGGVAYEFSKKKTQNTLFSNTLSVKEVFEGLRKLSLIEGIGSVDLKLKKISNLLTSSKGLESKYLIRTILAQLRVGVAEGTLRDAIAWAYLTNPNYDEKEKSINPKREEYNKIIDKLQTALDKTNDFVEVALKAKRKEDLNEVTMKLFSPVKVMLAQKVENAKEAFETVGIPAAAEYKYDGFRMQIHKKGDEVKIYTRRLEDVSTKFPEVATYVKEQIKAKDAIFDSEAVGFDSKTGKYTSFQHISKRIKRKYDIKELSKSLPVEVNIFDLLYLDKDLLFEPYEKRREKLEQIVLSKKKQIVLSKKVIVNTKEELEKTFLESKEDGNEGLMIKNLQGTYKPGSRVGYMLKYKKALDPLDLVIVKAEWGKGKRSGWLTSFTLACKYFEEYLEMGKVGTGLKEKTHLGVSFEELTNLLRPLISKENGREIEVIPKVVVSVLFEEIQKSPSYSSGYALRFPRIVALREEKSLDEIATLNEVEKEYEISIKK